MYSETVLVGRLTKDPEPREVTINGETVWVTNFSIATNDRVGNQDVTDYHNCVAWRKLAETVKNNLTKGRLVLVRGKNKTRSYDGQDGRKVYVTEVIADDVRFLDSKPAGQGGGQSYQPQTQNNYQQPQQQYQPTSNPTGYPQQQQQGNPYGGGVDIASDDLPF